MSPDTEPDLYHEPVRVPDTASLEEGFARKIQYPHPADGSIREFVLCRYEGRLFALDSLCPHEGGRISEGPLAEGRYAVCPLHLYRFDPEDGHSVGIECPPATTFAVREDEEDGSAEVWVGEDGAYRV